MSAPGYLLLAMDPRGSSWDRGAYWDLGGGAALAFVADAPEQADPSTGKWIQQLLDAEASELARRVEGASPEELSLLAADLMTRIGDHLLERGGGAAYAACALVLVAGGAAHVVVAGDCAAYLLPDGAAEARRVSDSTRVAGRSFVPPGAPARASHYAEAVYVGAEPRRFRPSDVIRVPVERDATVALVSDGAEDQLGPGALAECLAAHRDPKALEEAIGRELSGARLVDDVTLVAFRARGEPRGAEAAELRARLEELAGLAGTVAGLERELRGLRRSVEALPDRLDEQGGAVRDLRRAVADLKEDLGAIERRLGQRSSQRSLRELEVRLLRLEERQDSLASGRARGALIGLREEEDDEDRPARVAGAGGGRARADSGSGGSGPWGASAARSGWAGAFLRRHRRGLAAAGLVLAVVLGVAAAFLVSERGRAWLAGLGSEAEAPGAAEHAGDAAPAAAPAAAVPASAEAPVTLVYTPPASGSALGAPLQRIGDAAELARRVEAGPPGEPLAIPLELARPFWDRLAGWRWRPYAIRPGDNWSAIAERFVVPEERLLQANARIERRGEPVANPGNALRAADDVVRVPAFHLRVPAAPPDGGTWQALAARLGVEPATVRQAWARGGGSGEVLLPLTGEELPRP